MPEGVEVSNNSLAFTRPLERNDSAIYRCEVINDIGLRSQDVNFWVQGTLTFYTLLHIIRQGCDSLATIRFRCVSGHHKSVQNDPQFKFS